MTERDWTAGIKPEVLASITPRRHDADGHVYLAYFRKDRNLGFVWDGNIEHPIQVTHEMGEAVIDTFELGGPTGGFILPTNALFMVFKNHCDYYADNHEEGQD